MNDLKVARKGQICPSCGMLMKEDEDFGTHEDGGKNTVYCNFCFQKGGFTQPDLTLGEQIERLVEMAIAKMNIPEDLARESANKVLPNLARWRDG
jgi:hypothetical protein